MSKTSLSSRVEQLIRPDIQALSAYHVPDSSDMIKLDAMENPYLLPEELQQSWLEVLSRAELNRYPDPSARDLCETLARVMKVPDGNRIILGNGSDELIQILAMALAKPGAKLMAFEPGFVMYRMIAQFVGMEYIGVPLRESDFCIDLEATLEQIREHQPELIFIAYPNNPTGNLFKAMDIEAIVEQSEGLVVIDEAYQPFAEDTFMGLLGRHPNMLVMRTVSKLGLAGLRMGFMAGAEEWIEQFDKVRLPYNINILTQASARFALEHHHVFDEQAGRIRMARHVMQQQLEEIRGIEVFPSRANFILFRMTERDASVVFQELKERGILIKNLDPAGGMLKGCLRVTVGTEQENAAFISTLKDII